MKTKIIKSAGKRYLSELSEFKDGLPHGVVNKTEADRGGTYLAANCSHNYIIICPYRDLVESIEADTNNQYPIFKCYGGIKEGSFNSYCKKNQTIKIAVTYDSFPKVIRWIERNDTLKLRDFWVLVDEYHLLLEEMGFRVEAISNLVAQITQFDHYTFLSATPNDCVFEIDMMKELPHYTVQWDDTVKIHPIRYKSLCPVATTVAGLIKEFLETGLVLPDINNERRDVEQLFIFFNSVTAIEQICRTLDLDPQMVKICCADKKRNQTILNQKYQIEQVISPNKKINFFTKKGFQGCNLFSNNALVIVASDGKKDHTLIDISTTMKQIAGRLRENEEYHNCFRHIIVHIYSTNGRVVSDEEFENIMKEKRFNAEQWKDMTKGYSEYQMGLFVKNTDLEDELVYIVDNKLVDCPLKEQYYRYKHKLAQSYKDGFAIRDAYSNSDKFTQSNQRAIKDLDIIMKPLITTSYQDLLKQYLETPEDQYEKEYPEFKSFRQYLTQEEMHSLGWNKDKMIKRVEDKKQMEDVFKAVHSVGFISNKDLKHRFEIEFKKRGITISPKATLIKDCRLFSVQQKRGGYILGPIQYQFKL